MEFNWLNEASEKATVCMAVARVYCKGLSVEEALSQTLHTGIYCSNPESIPASQLGQLYETVATQVDSSVRG